jgi:2-hydroxychromene-2-carboxylate isomerase
VSTEGADLHFHFDYISHNAYIAWVRIHDIARTAGRRVVPVPTLFAGLLNAHGQLGPAEIPAKAWWMAKDVLRKAALLGIPLARPASHPFRPLLALRVSSLDMDPATQRLLIEALFRATWVDSRDVSAEDVVAEVAREVGLDGEQAVADASSERIKTRLRDQTDAAIAKGVFGVPTVEVGGEIFWGYDDLPMLELHLRGEDPLDEERLATWTEIRPSARRRRPGE